MLRVQLYKHPTTLLKELQSRKSLFEIYRPTFSRFFANNANTSRTGRVPLPSRSLIEVRGHDSSQFLQGLTTANIPSKIPYAPIAIYSAFLNAQGRLLQDVFIYPLAEPATQALGLHQRNSEPAYLIEVDVTQKSALLKWLRKYKLRSKVVIRPIDAEELIISSVWNDSVHSTQLAQTIMEGKTTANAIYGFDERAPNFGLRLISRVGDSSYRDQSVDEHHYTLRRYSYGIPEGQSELVSESALVHESCIDYMGGVDFRKGCYVGQELVIRTQHTGVVRKRIIPCTLSNESSSAEVFSVEVGSASSSDRLAEGIPAGSDIKSLKEDSRKARSKGKWISGTGNIGLALCRLEDVLGIAPTGERIAPLNHGKQWYVEFKRGEDTVRNVLLKGILPEWWTQRIKEI